MKLLKFKTQSEFDAWYENEDGGVDPIYYDRDFVCDITHADYRYLLSIHFINEENNIIPPLTIEQLSMFKENYGVRIVVINELFTFSNMQQVIIKRLRKCFDDAKRHGLMVFSSDTENNLYIFNGNMFDDVVRHEDLPAPEFEEVNGVIASRLSEHIELDMSRCEKIEGSDPRIDFVNWGCSAFPLYAHLKP